MKLEGLGENHSLSFLATCQTVSPLSSARSSGHLRIAPPHDSSFMPRFSSYHAASAFSSFVDLKNTPPIPVTRAMASPGWWGEAYPLTSSFASLHISPQSALSYVIRRDHSYR